MTTIISLLTAFFEAIVTLVVVDVFTPEEERRPFYVYGLFALVFSLLILGVNNLFLPRNLVVLNIISMLALHFMLALSLGRGVKHSAVIAVILMSVLLITELLTAFALAYVFKVSTLMVSVEESYRILGTVLSKLLAFFIIKLICMKLKGKWGYKIGTVYWLMLLLTFSISVFAITLLYVFRLYSGAETLYSGLAVWCSFGLLYNTFFSVYLYDAMLGQAITTQKQEVFRRQMRDQAKHTEDILAAQTELKHLRHDLKNHLIALNDFFERQDFDGGRTYLETLEFATDKTANTVETGNAALDAILNTKRRIAKAQGIAFETYLQIPENLFLDPVDTCIIFGNALDNAIEACERQKEGEKKIVVSAFYDEGRLHCKIVNTVAPEEMVGLGTTKQDKENHGFGIQSIKAALGNYAGMHSFIKEKGIFTLQFTAYK